MAICLSSFNSIKSVKPKEYQFKDWNAFTEFLRLMSTRKLKGKKDAELISPAIFEPGTTRRNANVLAWAGWAALDVDDHHFSYSELKNDLLARYSHWDFVCYSTASSTADKPKFRLVFNLSRYIKQEDIKHFWWALNSELESLGDKQTKDLSRMYYVPATYDSAFNFIFSNSGSPLDVDALLKKWPYDPRQNSKSFLDRLDPAIAEQVVQYRKDKLTNTGIVWSSYHDCPFWPRKLAIEYSSISETGWYHKMYQIMVAIAARAIEKEYPITATQIAELCKQFDMETGNWYENRPLEVEADRALEYAYRNI